MIAAAILVAAVGWFELHRDKEGRDPAQTGEATDAPGWEAGPDRSKAGPDGRPSGRDTAPARPSPLPQLIGADGQPVADPSLVPNKPGVGVPEGHGEVEPGADEDWLDRNRDPSEHPPPPLVPPAVADRDPGQPPTPQGAGAQAHEVWSGEPDAVEESVDPDAARAELQAAVQQQLAALSRCFEGGRLPPLAVTVQQIQQDDGRLGGYVSMIDHADGSELGESVEECLMEVLEDLALSAPPGASSAVVLTGPGTP